MNYLRHYGALIERARSRKTPEGYYERHHVVPRCMGGGEEPENLVALAAEEHFVAHQLLVKIHPHSFGLKFAAFSIGNQTNKRYAWLRKRHSAEMSGANNPMKNPAVASKTGAALKGRVFSGETLARMSAAKAGENHFFYGKLRPEHAAAMSGENNPSRRPEVRKKQSEAHLGRSKPLQACENCGKLMDAGNMKRWHSKICLKPELLKGADNDRSLERSIS
jgi:hypothetical protein